MAEPLSADEAKRIGLGFIREKYYRGTVTISETRLVTDGASPVYHFTGTIKMKPRGVMWKFIFTEPPFTFNVQVHGLEGSVISYEVR